jgi:small subunit ribosomal protein S11
MKKKKHIIIGMIYITSTFNNTTIIASDDYGRLVGWSSCGNKGFKGTRKATPFAAQITAENVAKKAQRSGIKNVAIRVKGPGNGRDSAIRAIINSGINVTAINDVTSLPHNGCRPRKKRRV